MQTLVKSTWKLCQMDIDRLRCLFFKHKIIANGKQKHIAGIWFVTVWFFLFFFYLLCGFFFNQTQLLME